MARLFKPRVIWNPFHDVGTFSQFPDAWGRSPQGYDTRPRAASSTVDFSKGAAK